MRMMVFFDLLTKTKAQQKIAVKFRNFLLRDGYYMVQFSVYVRVCNGADAVDKHRKRLRLAAPENGSIRVLVVTEKQYQAMDVILGKFAAEEEEMKYEQLTIF